MLLDLLMKYENKKGEQNVVRLFPLCLHVGLFKYRSMQSVDPRVRRSYTMQKSLVVQFFLILVINRGKGLLFSRDGMIVSPSSSYSINH